MELLDHLLWGNESLWGGGVAHSILILSLVITGGIMLGKIKIAGISLGVTGILFIGIAFGHFGLNVNEHLLHFLKEFGLILFVYSIGLQVGPGFFASFRKGGITLNKLAAIIVLSGVAVTLVLYYATGLPITTMVGIMSGAVTNTPGLGAAQQAFSDIHLGADADDIATGYAVAYPLGVIGAILTILTLRYLLRINTQKEEKEASEGADAHQNPTTVRATLEVVNQGLEGKTIADLHRLATREFVVSRICHVNGQPELVNAQTTLYCGDKILVITTQNDIEAIIALIGNIVEMNWHDISKDMISRKILITKPELNGKRLSELQIRTFCGVTITRVNRAGIDLVAAGNLSLQLGDRVTVVGPELSVMQAEQRFGNSLKRLDRKSVV